MEDMTEAKISRLQNNLATIRKVAGWTTAQLGEEIGMTRQSVSNLERGNTTMSKTQYIALRAVFNYEIAAHDNLGLAQVIRTLVDNPVEDSDEVAESCAEAKDAAEGLSNITSALAGETKIAETIANDKRVHAATLAAGAAIPALIPIVTQVIACAIAGAGTKKI